MRGYLRQRDGRPATYWELEVEAGRDPVTGKRRRVSRSFTGNRRAAERALNDLVSEVNRGRGTGADASLDDLLVRWLAFSTDRLEPATMRRYRRIVKVNIAPALGTRPLRRLEASDLDAFYRGLTASGLAPATVRQVHAVLRRALGQAVKWGWLPVNPAANATPPPARRAVLEPPTIAEALQLIAAAKHYGDGTLGVLLHLATTTGARRGELCGLRWTDIDLAECTLLIQRAITETEAGDLAVKSTKTHAARRIALDPGTLAVLAAHRVAMEMRGEAGDLGLAPDAYVFSDDLDGAGPWRPDRVTLAWRRLCQREGVKGIRLHDLRHAAATNLIAAGVDVRTVAGRLGHANPSVTLGVYSHFVQAKDRTAAGILGDLMGEG